MESARDKRTGEIVEAETLWMFESIDTDGYECWGCGIDMYPSSWKKENKKRPSFNKKPGKEHVDCDADAEREIVNQGQKRSVRQALDSAPGLSPSGLKLIEKRPAVDPDRNVGTLVSSSIQRASPKLGDGNTLKRESRRNAQTIRPICRAFIQFPYDRDISLNIPGIIGNTYLTAFKKLGNSIQPYVVSKVFYSQLLWQAITHDDVKLIIPLSGEWEGAKPARNYQIHVEWAQWSKAKKTLLLNELEAAQEEAKEAKNAGKKDKAWVFFIGDQDAESLENFYVKDSRLICSIIGHITYPKY